jgi:hypothetical protein
LNDPFSEEVETAEDNAGIYLQAAKIIKDIRDTEDAALGLCPIVYELMEYCTISAIAMFAISPHRVHYNQLLLIGAKSICLYSWKKYLL